MMTLMFSSYCTPKGGVRQCTQGGRYYNLHLRGISPLIESHKLLAQELEELRDGKLTEKTKHVGRTVVSVTEFQRWVVVACCSGSPL